MYKLLVSDFDNTLINSDEAIPLSTMVEIDRIRKNGCLFSIATGRNLSSVLDYNRDFPFIDYIISCNGAYVYDVRKGKVIFKKNMLLSTIKSIVKKYRDVDICFCTPEYWYLLTKNKNIKLYDREKIIYSLDDFYKENKTNIYKIELIFKNKKSRDNSFLEMEELNYKFNFNKNVFSNKKYGIEITMSGITKMTGVEKICQKEKISVSQVIAIGDDDSDISMIKNVGCGVAVSNASKELKKVSKIKTSSNDTKGVEKVIKKLL